MEARVVYLYLSSIEPTTLDNCPNKTNDENDLVIVIKFIQIEPIFFFQEYYQFKTDCEVYYAKTMLLLFSISHIIIVSGFKLN